MTNAFAGIGNPLVVLFDWQTGKQKQLLRPKATSRAPPGASSSIRTGFIAGAGGGNGGALWFWKPEQPQAFHTLKLPNNARDLDLHPDGRRLAVPFFDGAVPRLRHDREGGGLVSFSDASQKRLVRTLLRSVAKRPHVPVTAGRERRTGR